MILMFCFEIILPDSGCVALCCLPVAVTLPYPARRQAELHALFGAHRTSGIPQGQWPASVHCERRLVSQQGSVVHSDIPCRPRQLLKNP